MKGITLGWLLLLMGWTTGFAQTRLQLPYFPLKDTLKTSTGGHSVRKATLLSAFVPGAGQIYNRKYWKAPIVYAGLGTLGYLALSNGQRFNQYDKALKFRLDNDPATIDNEFPFLLDQTVFSYREQYRRYRDLSFIGFAAFWAIQVIDAHVDAHLYGINFDDEVYLRAKPSLIPVNQGFSAGIGLNLRF